MWYHSLINYGMRFCNLRFYFFFLIHIIRHKNDKTQSKLYKIIISNHLIKHFIWITHNNVATQPLAHLCLPLFLHKPEKTRDNIFLFHESQTRNCHHKAIDPKHFFLTPEVYFKDGSVCPPKSKFQYSLKIGSAKYRGCLDKV